MNKTYETILKWVKEQYPAFKAEELRGLNDNKNAYYDLRNTFNVNIVFDYTKESELEIMAYADINPGSSRYGQWVGVKLNPADPNFFKKLKDILDNFETLQYKPNNKLHIDDVQKMLNKVKCI